MSDAYRSLEALLTMRRLGDSLGSIRLRYSGFQFLKLGLDIAGR
jgi:hypothetical protein